MMCLVIQKYIGNVKHVQVMISPCLCNIQVWSGVAHVPSLSASCAYCMSAPMYCVSFGMQNLQCRQIVNVLHVLLSGASTV